MESEQNKLTAEVARARVALIAAQKFNDELAHQMEDELRNYFIHSVAAGLYEKTEAMEVAKIVASTSGISFTRYYS